MLGTEGSLKTSNPTSSYQELQLNATLDRFDLVTGLSYFQEDVYGSPGTGCAELRSAWDERFPGGGERQRRRRRQRAERLVRTVVTDGVQDLGVDRRVRECRRGISPTASTSRPDALRARREGGDGNALLRQRLRPVRRRAVDDDLRRRRLGQHRLAPDARLRTITDNHMLYVTSSEAFRSGAYSYNIAATSSGDAQTAAIAAGDVDRRSRRPSACATTRSARGPSGSTAGCA